MTRGTMEQYNGINSPSAVALADFVELLLDTACFSCFFSALFLMVYGFFKPRRQDGGKLRQE